VYVRRRTIFVCLGILLFIVSLVYGIRYAKKDQPVMELYDITLVQGTEMPIFYVKTDKKAMALTFDISWGEKVPTEVLDVLKEHDQKATFFLSGPWSQHYKDVVNRIVSDGHEIASHGQDHVNLSQESKEAIRKNIESAHNILVDLTGTTPRYFRPPNGDYDDIVVLTARELGYETVIWAVDSLDWKNPGATYIVERVSKLAFRGAIILFHASDSAKQTAEALPLVLENLKANGYSIVTLGELLDSGEPARDDPRGRPLSELPQ
jgi:polysaccharide deacetylase family sporulation protein PdaB